MKKCTRYFPSTFGILLSNSKACTEKVCLISQRFIRKKPTEPAHLYYRWGFKPLPVDTSLDEKNPQFAVRPPEFKLPNPKGRLSRREWRRRLAELQKSRSDPELEKLSRNRQLMVSLEDIDKEWRKEFGLFDLNNLSKFYGLNRDLFNNDDVVAKVWLDVAFNDVKIHRGNIIEPKKLLQAPTSISYEAEDNSLYSLILSNLDGHPLDSTKEIVHWMVCNIKGNDISNGETVYNYLPPLPWKGTGFHRVAFVLYEQEDAINTSDIKPTNESSLCGRTFSTPTFCSSTRVVPISYAWCQLEWDESVTQSFHKLGLKEEPIFDWEEYIEPKEEDRMLKIKLSELKYRNM
ncbi:39S ribosomal protein L38, mitochondrial-like [Hydractinia symbiolongicarpus]|uniref:39S ribosomal protein L38, mitochondrial-like n=1 Tax=Hydractinia symbiolongicarpus TaxID=13093 RepID=UPI00255143F7|nr:39S ribosomal protein L38, mitochondrial-like [Hydractinia symbiolongicarpus]